MLLLLFSRNSGAAVAAATEPALGNLGWSVSEKQLSEARELQQRAEKTRRKTWAKQQESRKELVSSLKSLYENIAKDVTAETAERLTEVLGPHIQSAPSTIAPSVAEIDWPQLELDFKRLAKLAEVVVSEIEAARQEQDDMEALQVILQAA